MNRFPLVLVFCATPALAQITAVPTDAPAPAVSGTVQQQVQTIRQNGGDITIRRAVPVETKVVERIGNTKFGRVVQVKAAATAKASPSPTPSATPEPKKRHGFFGFFRRLFGISDKEE
ncbi:MAG: hypothetical protein PHQ12_14515, partial [Chthoniobacteraceae bacterium]|nr:hypothetical protein [Chthoniobacteraceae bacterium]